MEGGRDEGRDGEREEGRKQASCVFVCASISGTAGELWSDQV